MVAAWPITVTTSGARALGAQNAKAVLGIVVVTAIHLGQPHSVRALYPAKPWAFAIFEPTPPLQAVFRVPGGRPLAGLQFPTPGAKIANERHFLRHGRSRASAHASQAFRGSRCLPSRNRVILSATDLARGQTQAVDGQRRHSRFGRPVCV
jgi:hypothetical protein